MTAQIARALRAFEQLARAGLPLGFHVERVEGQYTLRLTGFFGWRVPPENTEPVRMRRLGVITLAPAQQDPKERPMWLQLHRPDEIREDSFRCDYVASGKPVPCALRWVLKREGH